MAQEQDAKMLKVVLVIYAVISLVYGLGFLFVPGVLVNMGGGNPMDFYELRWSGGVIIALAIGALLVLRNPAKQGALVTTLALASSLAGLAKLYSVLAHEYSGATWFVTLPAVILLIVSALLWWSQQRAKKIL
jgi:uncharacterized membrane protein HdeD (DUF308 family)